MDNLQKVVFTVCLVGVCIYLIHRIDLHLLLKKTTLPNPALATPSNISTRPTTDTLEAMLRDSRTSF